MEKEQNALKNLAIMAKQRLKSGNYTPDVIKCVARNKEKASAYFYQNALALRKNSFIAEFIKITNKDDDAFVKKVYSLLDNYDLLCNPIGILVDKTYYNTLNEFEKQYYILSLSEKYNRVKDSYYLQSAKIS